MAVALSYGMAPADVLELEPDLLATMVAELEARADAG